MFGFGDYLAIKLGSPHLIIQTTSRSNMSAREKKILSLPASKLWLTTGGAIVIHGWFRKDKKNFCKVKEIKLDDIF